MKQRKKYYSRKFLNKDEGMAAIECIYDQHDARWGADISINISDCYRKVNLDFSIYDTKVIDKKIDKLRRFRDEIDKLLEVVEANAETIKEFPNGLGISNSYINCISLIRARPAPTSI